jgi:DNA repair photolyase
MKKELSLCTQTNTAMHLNLLYGGWSDTLLIVRRAAMPLKKATGNMYPWVTHTWNPVRGFCPYNCHYCYTHKFGDQKPLHLDEKELRVNLGSGNLIFVCSGCDLFHPEIPDEWFARVIQHVRKYQGNQYLWHTKNPQRVLELAHNGFSSPGSAIVCTTVESNRKYPEMGNTPDPVDRIQGISRISGKKMITVEPVMDFDTDLFAEMILAVRPMQVNIGADSLRTGLKEPSLEKIAELIKRLSPYADVRLKKNLKRLYPTGEYNEKWLRTYPPVA